VKASNEDDPICRFYKIQPVRKNAQTRRADIPVRDWKLIRTLTYSSDLPIEFSAESEAQPLAAGLIPFERTIDLEPRQRRQ
jgi:hypothetical protein